MLKLSVIIPIYNAANFLDICLASVIISDPEIEYILIDDGSTDDSAKIYQKYADHKNVTIKKTKNCGVSSARNLGLSLAKGKYTMFVDADDCLMKNWYSDLKSSLSSNANLIIVSKHCTDQKSTKPELLKACLGLSKTPLNSCSLMTPFSKLYRTKFLKNHRTKFNTDIIHGEDMLFNAEILLKTEKIKLKKSDIYFYRNNPSSATKSFNKKLIKSDRIFHANLRQLLKSTPYYKPLKTTLFRSRLGGKRVIIHRLISPLLPANFKNQSEGRII